MFNQIKDKIFNDGASWGMVTFAWTIETMLLQGKSINQAYEAAKSIYVDEKNLTKRLEAWKELNV
jgi:hypothetical protein